MHPDCRRHRDLWIAAPASVETDAHAERCAACRAWTERQGRIARAFAALPRVPAPARLAPRVAEAIGRAPDREGEGLSRALVSELARRAAPARLDELVAGRLLEERLAELGRSPVARALRGGERRAAPHVLDRLVAEELADPAAARARRFAGDLERLEAPADMPALRPLGASGRERRRRIVVAAGSLAAAAALVLALVLRAGPSEPTYRFEVVRLDASEGLQRLDPIAKALVNGLRGGILSAADRAPEGTPR